MTTSVLARSRLSERIRCAKPVAFLVAPAGCGKTVALTQYLASSREPFFRFDVRPEHRELLGFARGFSEAVDGACGTALREGVADAVARAAAQESPGEALARWIAPHLGGYRGTIAIDDMHVAMTDPACAGLVRCLVEDTVPRVRWILCGRGTGCLPSERWQAQGIAEVAAGDADFRFTHDEARAVAATFGLHVPDTDVGSLLSGTSGWAAALCMALRLRQSSRDVLDAVAAAHKLSYEYLAEQVYASLAPRERSLLAVGALLPEVDAGVLLAAGFDEADELLDGLYRRLSVLAPLRDDAPSSAPKQYRCHDLFRDFLVRQFELLDEDARRAMRHCAARALELCNRPVAALRLYALAGLTAETLRLLESSAYELSAQGHADTVTFALQTLAPEYAEHAVVLGVRGQLAHQCGRQQEAAALLERAVATSGDPIFRTKSLIVWSSSMLMHGANPIPKLAPAVESDEGLPPALRAELGSLLALNYAMYERERDTTELCERTERIAGSGEIDRRTLARVLARLARVASWHGRAERATLLFERAAAIALAEGAYRELVVATEGLAANAIFAGDLPRALEYAQRSSEAARKAGDAVHHIGALRQRAIVYFTAGMRDELDAAMAELRELIAPGSTDPALGQGELMAAAWDGDFASAHRRQIPLCDAQVLWETRAIANARAALFLAADGREREAQEFARRALAYAGATDWSRASCARNFAVAAALCSIALHIAGQRAAARRAVRTRIPGEAAVGSAFLALANAAIEGAPAAALEVHFAAIEAGWYGGYARIVRAALARGGAGRTARVLTDAELAVLQLLSEGATPKRVAIERGCSPYTVRKHITRIARKLECSGYRQAVRVARERGYLAEPK